MGVVVIAAKDMGIGLGRIGLGIGYGLAAGACVVVNQTKYSK